MKSYAMKYLETARKSAERLGKTLAEIGDQKIVLAESCTCGLAAAMLGGVPGISNYLCGSFVTYRVAAKQDWLGIDPECLREFTAESIEASQGMALAALEKTPEATWSAAITGHLGPTEAESDGTVYLCVAVRAFAEDENERCTIRGDHELKLNSSERVDRQAEAAGLLLQHLVRFFREMLEGEQG